MAGGQLVFEMGPRPSKWGKSVFLPNPPISNISDTSFVPTPVIKTGAKTFKDRLEVSLEAARSNLQIHYTTDGSEPVRKSKLFTKPFFINRTTTIKARAFFMPTGLLDAWQDISTLAQPGSSLVAAGTFHKIARNWTIKLLSKYNRQYTAGGDGGLIDGVRGTSNFGDGAWQGYQGQDLVAVVDLGTPQTVSKLGMGFLQDVGSWIWMPRSVDFELSTDGINFARPLSIINDVSDKDYGAIIKDLAGTISPQSARYIKVTAHNYGKIPSWHPGAGDEAFIFADEIIIE
jgi:hypothetical protein